MKQLSFLITFSIFTVAGFSQRIAKITITNTGTTEMISVQTDDAAVNITPDGTIINYGVEYTAENNLTLSRIEPYQGRIDLFGAYDDKSFQGKLKYLGKAAITYYASYDTEILRGKLKSIGSLMFTYYMQYDDEAIRGKIKSIGNNELSYYSAFDNEALRGKLRSVGAANLTYYSSFDDKAYKGRIKSIGQISFTYYSSYDNRYAGAMKTGSVIQAVNGITYYIKP